MKEQHKEQQELMDGIWLALDTSTAAMTIALMQRGEVVASSDSLSERNHSIRLLPAVEALLAQQGMKAKDLAGIAVGHGPGSYTGIRIGVTVAKMMAWSLHLPLVGISSLEALAYGVVLRNQQVPDKELLPFRKWIVPLMDARRGKVYTGLYEWSGSVWTCVVPDGIRLMEDWLKEIAARGHAGSVHFAGDVAGFMPLLEQFKEKADAAWDDQPLMARAVGKLAFMYGENRLVWDVHGYEPNYTQLSEPEKKLIAKKPVK